jgi:quinol monooxygenase YgiN
VNTVGARSSWQAWRVIVVTEHRADQSFLPVARELLEVLSKAAGFRSGQVARSPDEPDTWLFVTQWADVGSMRRGFGSFDAKVAAAPVMLSAVDRVSAFETLLDVSPDGIIARGSDLA